ncbi:MAG: DUF664 domain-containing protein [Streptosporangiales bacterium]|nr:DUF664 domain-containing protein [Streptosporangiales bacterium]
MSSARFPVTLDGPDMTEADPRVLLLGYLDLYRETVLRKIDGLPDASLRAPVHPLGWSPLALIKHVGWVERRWVRWGFAAERVAPEPPGGEAAEWSVRDDEPTDSVLAAYQDEVRRSRAIVAAHDLADTARYGGRFTAGDPAPPLGRILFHLLQEYARHAGQLDVARELIDGATGE